MPLYKYACTQAACLLFWYVFVGELNEVCLQEGSDSDRGINPRTLNRLFEMIQERGDYDYHVEFSIFEIYNEEIKDLLDRE